MLHQTHSCCRFRIRRDHRTGPMMRSYFFFLELLVPVSTCICSCSICCRSILGSSRCTCRSICSGTISNKGLDQWAMEVWQSGVLLMVGSRPHCANGSSGFQRWRTRCSPHAHSRAWCCRRRRSSVAPCPIQGQMSWRDGGFLSGKKEGGWRGDGEW